MSYQKYTIECYNSAVRGRNTKLHSHELVEILFYLKGSGTFHAPQRDHHFKPGTAIVIPAGLQHRSYSDEDFVTIGVADKKERFIQPDSPLILSDNEEGDGRALAEMLYRHRHENDPFVSELIDSYIHFWLQRAELPDATERVLNEVYRTLLEKATEKELDLAGVLTAGGYAEDYIRMLFKKRYGMPPLKFLAKLRMEEARFLLESHRELPLSEVAERCGYDDYVYFSKTFKTHTGQSPREYLKAQE